MKLKSAILVLVYVFIGIFMAYADEEIENLFDNPGFEEGKGKELQSVPGWKIYAQQNATGHLTIDTDEAIEGDQCLFVKVESVPAGGRWNLRLDHARRFTVKKGKTYTMSFWLKGDPGPITLSPSRAEKNEAGGGAQRERRDRQDVCYGLPGASRIQGASIGAGRCRCGCSQSGVGPRSSREGTT